MDAIYDYNNIIEKLQKLYEQTPVTQRYARARIISGIRKSKREWQKLRLNMKNSTPNGCYVCIN